MTDGQLNEWIDNLLCVPSEERIASDGNWADYFDRAMLMWEDRHPGTRPPAFEKIGSPPSCFEGDLPPIYDGALD
jgi:hypothetical protein